MIGGISATMIASSYEQENVSSKNFPLFTAKSTLTGNTVMKIALADSLLRDIPFAENMRHWGRKYPAIHYCEDLASWIQSDSSELQTNDTCDSAMRVSPIGFAFPTPDKILEIAKQTAILTHNSADEIAGTQAVALCIFWANFGMNKDFIMETIQDTFHYDLTPSISTIRSHFEASCLSCSEIVSYAIITFLSSISYEDTIRNAILVGGDHEAIACIAGDIAAAYYKEIPNSIMYGTYMRLPQEFIDILVAFNQKYNIKICPI